MSEHAVATATPPEGWERVPSRAPLGAVGEQPGGPGSLRAAGQRWVAAGMPPEPGGELAGLFANAAGTGRPIGGRLLEDFLAGVREGVAAGGLPGAGGPLRRDVAADLIDGRPLHPAEDDALEERYAIVVVRRERIARTARPSTLWRAEHGGPGTLLTRRDGVLVLLVPDVGDRPEEVVRAIQRERDGQLRIAVAHRTRARIPEGYQEGRHVAALAAAGRRPPGVYGVDDVLLEYAATRDEAVAARLRALVAPVRRQEPLWETLLALIDAHFNGNEAARAMVIPRSTLDHRLSRIAKLTGIDPRSGDRTLAVAATATLLAG